MVLPYVFYPKSKRSLGISCNKLVDSFNASQARVLNIHNYFLKADLQKYFSDEKYYSDEILFIKLTHKSRAVSVDA